MADGIRWVGLDVHARESTFAVFDQGTGEVTTRRVVGRPHELLPWLRSVERPARKHPRSSTSPGARNAASTPAGANSKTPAANPAGSSLSRSPASSPPTAGRSPPARPQRRNRRPHQPPARGSPTHAEPLTQPVAAGEAARAIPARAHNSAIRRLSTRPRRARSTLDSGRATNKGLGVPSPRI